MKTKFTTLILLMLFAILSFGQPGTLDGDFDADGKVTTDIGFAEDGARVPSVLYRARAKSRSVPPHEHL